MKMMNFRRFDPTATAEGRGGLTRGNKEEEIIWNEFADDPARLQGLATAIVTALRNDQDWKIESSPYDDGFCEAPEGRVLTRMHLTSERNRKLVERKKSIELSRTGRLVCEVCDFNFETRYGERGREFIEVHHTKPVHTLENGATTKLDDLALVCANCHRMIHSAKPWLELEQLRALLRPA
jgi:5-methylcytosine-specific restriction protein A